MSSGCVKRQLECTMACCTAVYCESDLVVTNGISHCFGKLWACQTQKLKFKARWSFMGDRKNDFFTILPDIIIYMLDGIAATTLFQNGSSICNCFITFWIVFISIVCIWVWNAQTRLNIISNICMCHSVWETWRNLYITLLPRACTLNLYHPFHALVVWMFAPHFINFFLHILWCDFSQQFWLPVHFNSYN